MVVSHKPLEICEPPLVQKTVYLVPKRNNFGVTAKEKNNSSASAYSRLQNPRSYKSIQVAPVSKRRELGMIEPCRSKRKKTEEQDIGLMEIKQSTASRSRRTKIPLTLPLSMDQNADNVILLCHHCGALGEHDTGDCPLPREKQCSYCSRPHSRAPCRVCCAHCLNKGHSQLACEKYVYGATDDIDSEYEDGEVDSEEEVVVAPRKVAGHRSPLNESRPLSRAQTNNILERLPLKTPSSVKSSSSKNKPSTGKQLSERVPSLELTNQNVVLPTEKVQRLILPTELELINESVLLSTDETTSLSQPNELSPNTLTNKPLENCERSLVQKATYSCLQNLRGKYKSIQVDPVSKRQRRGLELLEPCRLKRKKTKSQDLQSMEIQQSTGRLRSSKTMIPLALPTLEPAENQQATGS